MGEVYRARDTKLDRDVAVKVLPASFAADPEAVARFEREAKAVAALSHPNILAIHDFGAERGIVYAVMELLDGETLRSRIDAGPISAKQALEYAVQIAKALSAAHEKGVVHRDLKPENVFVTGGGHVKILDFGLAKRVLPSSPGEESTAPTVSSHTTPGTVMGTVAYMAPEQVRGLPVDHRCDIFSFGVLLYELFSGANPFRRATAADTMSAILNEEPPEPAGKIPAAIDHVLRRCVEKDRDDRFQSARDAAFALSDASGLPAQTDAARLAAPPHGKGRIRKVVLAGTVLLMALVAVLAFLRRTRGSAEEPGALRRVAVLPFENVGSAEDDYFADGIADEIRGKLTSVQGIEVIARASSIPYKKTAKPPRQIARELDVRYLLTATVRWQKGTGAGANRVHVTPELVEVTGAAAPASRWQQPFDAALTDVFQVQSDIASRVALALGVALGTGDQGRLAEKPTQNLAAYDAFLKGEEIWRGLAVGDPPRVRAALDFYERAAAIDPLFAQAWARISWANSTLHANGNHSPAVAERARSAAEKAVTLAPARPEGYHALGNYRRLVLADYDGALEQYTTGRRFPPPSADLFTATALAEESLGRWDGALEHLRMARRLDPRSVPSALRLGQALLFQKRYPEAAEALDGGLRLAPANLVLIESKAMTRLGTGDLAGAKSVFAAVPESVDRSNLVALVASNYDLYWVLDEGERDLLVRLTPAAFDGDRAQWGICMAQAFALKDDAIHVRIYAEEARKALEEQLRAEPDDPIRHAFLGLMLSYLGRMGDAIREGERAVTLLPVTKDAIQGPYLQHQLVRIYIVAGEPEKALDILEPLLTIPYVLSPGWLKIDPNFDPVRRNPRFQKLLRRL